MKSLVRTLCVLTLVGLGSFTFAQTSVLGGLEFGSQAPIGLNGGLMFGLTENVRVKGAFTYTFPDTDGRITTKWSHIDVDVQYYGDLFDNDQVTPYALAGLGVHFLTVEFDAPQGAEDFEESETRLGLNLGIGTQINLSNGLTPFAEVGYNLVGDVSDETFSQAYLQVGMMFPLGGGRR